MAHLLGAEALHLEVPTKTVFDSVTIVVDRPEFEWAGDPHTRDVTAGLVDDLVWDTPVEALSGGQRRLVRRLWCTSLRRGPEFRKGVR